VQALWLGTENTKGEGSGFPQVWAVVSLESPCLPVVHLCACPSILEMLRAREHTLIPYPSIVFTFGLVVEFIKEFGGASLNAYIIFEILIYNMCNLCIYLSLGVYVRK